MTRRELISLLSGAAAAWPLAARAQQARPVIAFLRAGSGPVSSEESAFQKGLGETGYVEGQNVTIEYHSLDGQYDRLPTLVADLLACHVAVIAMPAFSSTPMITIAKATGGSIPIVFGVGDDPVKAWSGREPCTAGRQCDWNQFLRRGNRDQTVCPTVRAGAQGSPHRRHGQSEQSGGDRGNLDAAQ